MEQKTFTRRDSATSYLRKLGFDKDEYNDYILAKDGAFKIWVHDDEPILHADAFHEKITGKDKKAAEKALKENVVKTPINAAEVNAAEVNAAEVKGHDVRTVSGRCRSLVQEGKTNAEIWAVVKSEFNLGDNKKHYPAWYRAELNRKAK